MLTQVKFCAKVALQRYRLQSGQHVAVFPDKPITVTFSIFGMEDLQVGYHSLQQIEQLLPDY